MKTFRSLSISFLLGLLLFANPSHSDVGILSGANALDIFNAMKIQPSVIEDEYSKYYFKTVAGLRCLLIQSSDPSKADTAQCILGDRPNYQAIYESLNVLESATEDIFQQNFQKSMKSVGTSLRCSKTTTTVSRTTKISYDCFGSFQ